MAENKKYIIRISGRQVEVSREVYQAYYGIERHTRTLDEKDQRHGLVRYSNLDTPELSGEAMIPDCSAVSTEDAAIVATHLMLAATDEGVDSCWINCFHARMLHELLGLPEREELLMLLDLGYAAEGSGPLPNHSLRKPLSETVTRI